MPTPRYWEMEEGRVDLSRLEPAADDLGRMLLMEFVLVYSNDWQLIPLDVPVGTVLRVASLKATDTFGNVLTMSGVSAGRRQQRSVGHVPALAAHRGRRRPPYPLPATGAPLFLLPPVLGAFQQSARRSKRSASCATRWSTSPGASSASCRLRSAPGKTGWKRRSSASASTGGTSWGDLSVENLARYELATRVPRYWIPLLPVPTVAGGRKNASSRAACSIR